MTIESKDVSAVIVTRGDVDLTGIVESLDSFAEVMIWVNGDVVIRAGDELRPVGPAPDLAVYGRYAAIEFCAGDLVYVQDDDCLVNTDRLLAEASEWDPSGMIVANMPVSRWTDYPDSCLVGWGSVFGRDLPAEAFGRYSRLEVEDGWSSGDAMLLAEPGPFLRECDVVFSTLTPHVKVDVGFQHLPWAEDPERAMFLRPWRAPERDQMYYLARLSRDSHLEGGPT